MEEKDISVPKKVWEDASLVCLGVAGDSRQREGLRKGAQKVVDYIYGLKEALTSEPKTPKLPYAHAVPTDIYFYKTTIEKHYYPSSACHKGSIRITKPEPSILVYLGCLLEDKWDAEKVTCSPNPTVIMTIVPNSEKYRADAEDWIQAHSGIKAHYLEHELGVEPRVKEEVVEVEGAEEKGETDLIEKALKEIKA